MSSSPSSSSSSCTWSEIGDHKAIAKTCQALRERVKKKTKGASSEPTDPPTANHRQQETPRGEEEAAASSSSSAPSQLLLPQRDEEDPGRARFLDRETGWNNEHTIAGDGIDGGMHTEASLEPIAFLQEYFGFSNNGPGASNYHSFEGTSGITNTSCLEWKLFDFLEDDGDGDVSHPNENKEPAKDGVSSLSPDPREQPQHNPRQPCPHPPPLLCRAEWDTRSTKF